MATPRAATGSGLRRRRLRTSITGRAASTARVVRRHRRREPRTGVARAAQDSRQPVCQVRATTPTGDPHGAERVRIGGPQADTGGKVAVEPRSLPAHDHAETYPAPAGRQGSNAQPTGTAAPRPNGRLARSEASRTARILGDRHLGSNRGRGAVNDAIRSCDRVYRNCEDPPPGAHSGRMLESGEPGSLVGIGTCDAATRRHPTTDQLATAKRHRSALAGHARATRGTRRSISPRRPRRRSSAIAGDRSRRQRHPAVAHMRCHPRRLHHRPARRSPLGHDPDRQLHTGPRRTHRRAPHAQATGVRPSDRPDRRRPRGAPNRDRAAPAPTPAGAEAEKGSRQGPGHRAPAGHSPSEDRDARHAPTVRHPRDRRGRARSTGGHRAPPDQKSARPRRGPNRPADYRWPISVLWPRAFAAPRGASPHPPRVRAMRSPLRWTALDASALEKRPLRGQLALGLGTSSPVTRTSKSTTSDRRSRTTGDTSTTPTSLRALATSDSITSNATGPPVESAPTRSPQSRPRQTRTARPTDEHDSALLASLADNPSRRPNRLCEQQPTSRLISSPLRTIWGSECADSDEMTAPPGQATAR